jgi:hypothetical protein
MAGLGPATHDFAKFRKESCALPGWDRHTLSAMAGRVPAIHAPADETRAGPLSDDP